MVGYLHLFVFRLKMLYFQTQVTTHVVDGVIEFYIGLITSLSSFKADCWKGMGDAMK